MVLVGTPDGHICLIALNGTEISRLHVAIEGSPITAIVRSAALLAVATGTHVHLVDLVKMKVMPSSCKGSLSTISTMKFDAHVRSLLHVATQDGDAIVFNVRAGGGRVCLLFFRFILF